MDEPVIVDTSAPDRLSEVEMRAWAGDQRVFISSVMGGMLDERAAVAAAIDAVGAAPVWFEKFGGRDDDPEAAYLTEVASSDIYVGILGERYGNVMRSGYSATHEEYNEALRQGLRMSVWTTTAEQDGRQRDFLQEIRVFRTTGSYTSPADLAEGVAARLHGLAAEAHSPWVKIGPTIVRVQRIDFDGHRIEIETRVRNSDALAALEGLRPDGTWRTGNDLLVTWGGTTVASRVEAVQSRTVAGRGRLLTITASSREQSSDPFGSGSVNGLSAEAMTNLALRIALFGEAMPADVMSFMVAMDNPFYTIDALRLPEDAVEPIAGLFLTEALVGSGKAERITSLAVGPSNRGERRIAVEWLPKRRYSNVTPELQRVTGATRTNGPSR